MYIDSSVEILKRKVALLAYLGLEAAASQGRYSVTFTPVTAGNPNVITHFLNSKFIIVKIFDIDRNEETSGTIDNFQLNSVDITFGENPIGDVKILILTI